MTFKTLILIGFSAALLSACSAPNEYSTYDPDNRGGYYMRHKDKYWEHDKANVPPEPAAPVMTPAPDDNW